jgi:hypothetical protein
MPLHFGVVGQEKLFIAICGCWFVRVLVCRSVYDMWGPGELFDFLGCRATLAYWLLRLLLSFDYQNPCLLFLKLQVQDQNDYLANCLRLIFKIHPTCVRGIYA